MFMHLVCLLVTLLIIFGLAYAKPLLQNRNNWIRAPMDYPLSLYNRIYAQPRPDLDEDIADDNPPSDEVREGSLVVEGYEHSDLWQPSEVIQDQSPKRIPEIARFLGNNTERKENEGRKVTETAQPLVAQDNIDRNMKEKLTKEHMLQTLQSTFAPTNKFNSNQIYMILQESLKQNMTESRSVPETTTTGRKSTSKENGTPLYANDENASKVGGVSQRVQTGKSCDDSIQ
ncbi:hypothetical protein KM043_001707 [Ampulex compressa]|nr:hypothetical protein KM043_001707 [Ampulex compressa]